MNRMAVATACVAALLVAAVSGQAVDEDRISGIWALEERPMLELKADAAGAVSGTVFLYRGPTRSSTPVGAGRFDRRAGTLTLTGALVLADGTPGQYRIDGALQDGTLRVTYQIGPTTGSGLLRRVAARPPDATGTVLITGSNRGLGLELVKQYAAAGWTVIATARDPDRATELRMLAAADDRIRIERLDVRDTGAITALAARYRGTPIDVVLNNAGVLGDLDAQTLGSLDYAQFEEVMAVNVFAPLAVAEAFLDHVARSRQKTIVSLTSRSGIISQPGWRGPYFYRASKVGLNMVMRVLAEEVRDRGVIVALVSPPPTDTDMLRALIGPEGASRQARPADVAGALLRVIGGLTLASSERVTYVDGTALPW